MAFLPFHSGPIADQGQLGERRNLQVMKRFLCFSILVGLASLLPAKPKLDYQITKEGVLITESGEKVLFYQRTTKAQQGKHARANYIHPLYDLSGNILTEDFPKDHPHHRGIFWAWHFLEVNGKRMGDGWTTSDRSWDVRKLKVEREKDESLTLHLNVHWKSIHWHEGKKPIVNETTQIRIHPREGNLRKIDFDIRLLATQPDTRIGGAENEKGYGGFSTRIKLPEDIQFTGKNGTLTPQHTSVSAGPWMDMKGKFNGGKTSGLTILCHPKSAGHPQSWILRDKKSMQNPVWPGQKPKIISRKKPVILRYRLILHQGKASPASITQWEKNYSLLP